MDLNAVFFNRYTDSGGDLYVNNKHNIVEKHFSMSIVPVRSRDGSLVGVAQNNMLHKKCSPNSFEPYAM
jgi:hypothetical protein